MTPLLLHCARTKRNRPTTVENTLSAINDQFLGLQGKFVLLLSLTPANLICLNDLVGY